MPRPLRTLALVWAALAVASTGTVAAGRQSGSERRVALVIGNDRYAGPMVLQNARRDATAIAAELRSMGFETTLIEDATRQRLNRAVEGLASSITASDVVLFYYAGHGAQVGGENYLIPVDYAGNSEQGLALEGVRASQIQGLLSRARVSILVLDACRNNPYSGGRSTGGGLAAMEAKGSLVAFATGAGQIAGDNPGGAQGTFTGALLESLRQPGLSIRDVFYRARVRVHELTGGQQFPAVYDGLLGDIVLRPASPGNAPPSASRGTEPPVATRPAPRGAGPAPGAGLPPAISPSPAPGWLIGDFRGVNPVTKSNVELTVHADGTITGFADAGSPRPTPVRYVWVAATNQMVDASGAYTFDVERTDNAFRTRQVGTASNTVTYRRVYLPPAPPTVAGARAVAPDTVRRATPDELATMYAVINEWAPAWETLNDAAGRIVYPTWNIEAIRAARAKEDIGKVSGTTVTCSYASVRRDQADVRCRAAFVLDYKLKLISSRGQLLSKPQSRKVTQPWTFGLFWNGSTWLIETFTSN